MMALGAFPGLANDVSSDGSVIVGRYSLVEPSSSATAFRWTAETGFVNLPHLTGLRDSHADRVSDDGTFITGRSADRAVRWMGDGPPIDLGVGTTLPVLISADGSVASGTIAIPPPLEAFRWTATEGAVPLGGSFVEDMTPDGRVIVGVGSEGGFRWTAETGMTEVAILPRGISDDGGLLIGRLDLNRPALWTEATGAIELQPFLEGLGLDLTGWTLTRVNAISGDGTTLAGQGIPPDPSMSGAWVAVIPEPSTWLLAGTALSIAAIVARFRRR
jgi:uncharacterized membrane protein